MIILGLVACFYSMTGSMNMGLDHDTNLEHVKGNTILCQYDKRVPKPQKSNKDVWDYAYMGDYNLTHKLALLQGFETREDIILGCLALAYERYREGDEEGMYDLLRNLDRFIEQER